MIVFKAFLSVLKKCKGPIIIFTIMLVLFGALNFSNNSNTLDFTSVKPDVVIVNEDVEDGITKSFIDYIEQRSEIVDISNDEISDALFYRNVNYVIYIPKGFRDDVINGKEPNVLVKSTGDYNASLANMMVNRYMKVLNLYSYYVEDEEELISLIKGTLEKEVEVQVTSKLDTYNLSKMSTYFNFMNYSILAGLVYVISLVLSSFYNDKIRKRTVVSSIRYKSFNRYLLLSNGLFAFVLWALYIILSVILLGDIVFSLHGLICIVNSLIFTLVSLVIALLIGNLINNKNAINGIVNVVALGSSFICGAFVPVEFMPDFVVNLGKVLPSYYFINTNNIIKSLEEINLNSLKPVFINFGIMFVFIVLFVILINVISKSKRKFA